VNKKSISFALAVWALMTAFAAHAATEWSAQEYDLYPGDFDGDGRTDVLYVAKDPAKGSGIARSDASGASNAAYQTWPANFLGIPWYGNTYTPTVADFNGDGRADIFLQRKTAGDHYVLIADEQGKFAGIHQTIANSSAGVVWSADQHHILAGDFNNDGRADLFFQATSRTGLNGFLAAGVNGIFSSVALDERWNDGFLGLDWSSRDSVIHIGNFDGQNGSDILVQERPSFVTIAYEVPFPISAFGSNKNGVVLTQAGGPYFTLSGLQAWSRNSFGIDWSPLSTNIVVGDFNGDEISDVLAQAMDGSSVSYLSTGTGVGAVFSAAIALASNVSWSGTAYRLLAGDFDGNGAVGIFFQALNPEGANHYANTITGSSVTTIPHNAAIPTGVVPATSVGKTDASFAVTNMGTATYSIPIVVPPGVGGVQPNLAMAYQSGAGNGQLGMGWGLVGLSEIERCPKSLDQDGVTEAVMLTTADRFCLDGNKLRLTAGSYGVAGSTYQTELETFSRVTAFGIAGNGPQYFVLEGKDGLKYEYGSTSDSRIEARASTTIRTWALSKVSDRSGNTLVVTYIDENDNVGGVTNNGSYRPAAIAYTSNANAGLSAAYKILFQWENRPDVQTGYAANGQVKETQRLRAIETQYNDPDINGFRTVRKYQLSYNSGGTTGRSRLSAVQECGRAGKCLSPTLISWQDGAAEWTSTEIVSQTDAAADMAGAVPIDFDGDGRDDLVYRQAGVWWYVRSRSGTFATPATTTVSIEGGFALPIDYNSDGRMDLLIGSPLSSTRQILSWNGASLAPISTTITVAASGSEWIGDFDGDGRSDFLYGSISGSVATLQMLRNLGPSAVNVAQFGAPQTMLSVPVGNGQMSLFSGNSANTNSKILDFNGDGRADFVYQIQRQNCSIAPVCLQETSWHTATSIGSSFQASSTLWTCLAINSWCAVTPIVGDFNGDALTDLLGPRSAASSTVWDVAYGTRFGLTTPVAANVPSALNSSGFAADYNGDGRSDLIYSPTPNSGSWYMAASNGADFDAAVPFIQVPAGTDAGLRLMDVDGDGQRDIGYKNGQYRTRRHDGAPPDLVSSIADGYGNTIALTYTPLTDSTVYTKGTGSTFPDMELQIPIHVVSRYVTSDGAGGTYAMTQRYSGARLHVQGRGFKGFALREETDGRTGIRSTATFRQDFPYIGQVATSKVQRPGNGASISEATNTYGAQTWGTSALGTVRSFVYLERSVEKSYEIGGTATSQQISQVTTTQGFDAYGNLTDINVITLDPVTSQSFRTRQLSTFSSDATDWCISLETRTEEWRYLPNGTQQHRVTTYLPDADTQKCRTSRQVVEPDSALWMVATDFAYDAFGNLRRQEISANGIANRVSTMSYGTQGVFPVSATNAENESGSMSHDYALGVPLSATDANGITVTWRYDDFGRKTHEILPDGTQTTWALYACGVANSFCGDYLLRYQVLQQHWNVGAKSVLRSALRRGDSLGRTKYDESQSFSGAMSVIQTQYDNRGRVWKRSHPYFAGFAPVFTTFTYDILDRPLTEERRTSEADANIQSIDYTYARLFAGRRDANGTSTGKAFNVIGQMISASDAGNTTFYDYDPFGSLSKSTNPYDDITSAIFNVRGFKTDTSDPDMGSWVYDYYPTGELKSIVDAKGQSSSFTYDRMGRMRSRVEPEGTTVWTYGSSASARNVGKVVSVTAPGGYSEVFVYDSLGRPQDRTTTIDSIPYVVSSAYSASTGLLDTLTYPTSTGAVAGSRFKVKYEYAHGLLQRVRDFTASGPVFWEKIATGAAGETLDEQFGNGLHNYSTYDDFSGFLTARFVGASTQVQNLTFDWYKSGDLLERKDLRQNLSEVFHYDNVNRLDHSTLRIGSGNLVTNLNVDYDSRGNIEHKSDVGDYDYLTAQSGCSYHAHSQPHAARSAGGTSYCYDANGNMIKRGADAFSWTSYNKPSQVYEGANSSQFWYGPGRSRFKQVTSTATGGSLPPGVETTVYIGGLFEKVTRLSGPVEYRHYIVADGEPVAVKTLKSVGVDNIRYLHKDHLGSIDVVTDEAGAVLMRQSFDAFGARRNASSWSGPPSSGEWAAIDASNHRGFTGHESLDSVGLIHMNGRAYDPRLGRFISADPIVQALVLPQSLNRYSYVMNNPLSLIDPSGYSWLSSWWRKIEDAVKSVTHSLNTVIGAVLVVVGVVITPYAPTFGPALINTGISIMKSPIQVNRVNGGYGFSFRFGFSGAGFGIPFGSTGTGGRPSDWSTGGSSTVAGVPVLYTNGSSDGMYSDPSVWDFLRNATREVSLSYGDNSWALAYWNVFADSWVEAGNNTIEGNYGGATIAVGMAVVPELRVAKKMTANLTRGASSLVTYIPTVGRKFNQLAQRGWSREAINMLVNNPFTTRAATNRATGNAATAFVRADGHYVVRDDITGELVQMSDTRFGIGTGPGQWLPDSSIIDPFIPGP